MPVATQKVKLGRDQVLTLDGKVLEGVREVDLDVSTKTVDVTSWVSFNASTLPIVSDATIRLLIYWKEDWDKLSDKINQHPPKPVTLGISNAYTIRCIPSGVKIMQPIAGVLAWEVTLKPYGFQ